MNVKPIKSEADYRQTLKDIESLMLAEADTPEGDRLDVLVTLVEAYERAHFPMDLPDAVELEADVAEQGCDRRPGEIGPRRLLHLRAQRHQVDERWPEEPDDS